MACKGANSRRIYDLITTLLIIAYIAGAALCQIADPAIQQQRDEGKLGYQERQPGILYEGTYKQPVASTGTVDVLAFWKDRLPSSWNGSVVIGIRKPHLPSNASDIPHIRACCALLSNCHYRMDAWFAKGDLINWHIGTVLQNPSNSNMLAPADIGICGWFLDNWDTVYVPLRLFCGTTAVCRENRETELVIRTSVSLSGYFCRFFNPTTGQRHDEFGNHDTIMPYEAIRIPIPENHVGRLTVEFSGNILGTFTKCRRDIHLVVPSNE